MESLIAFRPTSWTSSPTNNWNNNNNNNWNNNDNNNNNWNNNNNNGNSNNNNGGGSSSEWSPSDIGAGGTISQNSCKCNNDFKECYIEVE